MKKKFIIIIICLVQFHSAKPQNCNIILGRPTNSAVTASILFDQAVQFYLEYGETSGFYTMSTATFNAASGKPEEVDMTGLLPDKKYYYRAMYKLPGASTFSSTSEYSFYTQRAKGSTFTFTIESDEHLYDIKGVKSLYQICLNNQAKDNPDFILSLGDIFGDDHYPFTITPAQADELHKNYRPFLGSVCHSVPFFVCLGNHEGENDYYLNQNPPNNLAVWSTQWRKYYYPNPFPNDFYSGNTANEPYGVGNPENYYSWTWGDAQFVVLDVYRDQCDTSDKPGGWAWTLGKPQYDWLKATLETSTSKYKFVFAHHVRGQGRGCITNAKLFEWGGYEQNGTNFTFPSKRPGWTKPIQQLFKDNGVTIFFQGHDHLFAKEELDGVVYQEVPMPSDSTYSLGIIANGDAYTSTKQDGSGHLRVTVSPSGVKVDYVRAYLPADTLSGVHKNGEVTCSYIASGTVTDINEPVTDSLQVKIYPNPAKEILHLLLPQDVGQFDAVVFDMLGRPLTRSQSKDIDISHFSDGIYFVKIIIGLKSITKKINIIH